MITKIAYSILTAMPYALIAPSAAIAQSLSPISNCTQLTNRRYGVILDRPANLLPQLPEFLAIAAVPCDYLNTSMTFFGGFDNIQTSTFRANQLRELKLDAVIHSFSQKTNDIPSNFQAALVLVELGSEPNLALQRVQAITGRSASLATFNNRSVILTAPLSSVSSANAIASRLRGQGVAAQVLSASLIAMSSNAPPTAVPVSPRPPVSSGTSYRVLVPNSSANRIRQVRQISPDAFVTEFKGKSYIQARTYTDRGNARRERDRLNASFPGTILIQD
ncbi:MAG: hypothetical protein AUK48_10240 [Oscillatoriales cyanobacterium CG2_30_44_21]|nr:MAG: hypothetical protein AUK48_10240 [Oscillatoriales cyanobacterium CG2_30_44_21]